MFEEPKSPLTISGKKRPELLAEGPNNSIPPRGEVDASDRSPNHHGDLVYGNHLSAEQTPPAHHRGIFQRLLKAKSNISRGAGGEGCRHLHCLSALVSVQQH